MKAYSEPIIKVQRFESECIRTGEIPVEAPIASLPYAHYTKDADIMSAKVVYRINKILSYKE